jgi:uncharacterized protein involved in type VI secretion and phage assembly
MATSLEDVVGRLVELVEHRHFGKYRGMVADNDDPDGIGRVRATVPRLLGDVQTGWALPASPFAGAADQGLFLIPEVGAGVWIEFEGGDLAYPIWSGSWWGDGEVPESATFQQKVLKTIGGQKVLIDDDAGSITLEDTNGNSLVMDSAGIALADANGNAVTLDSAGIKLEDPSGNSVTLASAGVAIKGATIKVGDPPTDSLVGYSMLDTALTTFATMIQTHTHVGNLGAPTSPPVPPPTLSLTPARSHHQVEL